MRSSRVTLVLVALAVPVLAAAATAMPDNVQTLYRECMRSSMQAFDTQDYDSNRTYNDAQELGLRNRMSDRLRAWDIANDGERQARLSEIEKIYKNALSEAKTIRNNDIKRIKTDLKSVQTECKAAILTAYSKDRRCQSTSECKATEICTTERGACDRMCGPNDHCLDACVGFCEKR